MISLDIKITHPQIAPLVVKVWNLEGIPRNPCVAPRGLGCATLRGSLGTNFETKMLKFRWFLGPSDQNHLFLAEDPFDVDIDLCLVNVIVSDF